MDALSRLLDKVDQSGDCWLWTGARQPRGYGWFWYEGRGRQAHRVAYELLRGPIPDGLEIDHLCRTPRCVNPDHLEPVTARENVRRGSSPAAAQARRTHCPAGHPYEGDNLYVHNGKRHCRSCAAAWHRSHKRTRRRTAA